MNHMDYIRELECGGQNVDAIREARGCALVGRNALRAYMNQYTGFGNVPAGEHKEQLLDAMMDYFTGEGL
jgi:hypothetical protein